MRRGGVPVAYEVAQIMLGLPGEKELTIGAIASGGIRILNQDIIDILGINQMTVDRVTKKEIVEIQHREQKYGGDRPAPYLQDRKVILVDDGLATGATMLATVSAIHIRHPAQVVAAIPTAST